MPLYKGITFMKTHKTLTLGMSVAAVLAFALLPFITIGGGKVEASTILASLRQATCNALDITFSDLGDDGVIANGQIIVVFERNGQGKSPFDAPITGIFVDASVVGELGSKEAAGLDARVQASLMPGDEWIYIQSDRLPDSLAKEEPVLVALFGPMVQNGVLLKCTGMLRGDLFDEGVGKLPLEELPSSPPVKTWISIGAEETTEAAIENLIQGMLRGDLKGADFDNLIGELEQVVREEQVSLNVENRGAGLHVLRLTDFPKEKDASWTKGMIVEVAYQEGKGVPWARVEHVGPYDGTLHIETADVSTDNPKFNHDRFISDGRTQVFDLDRLLNIGATLQSAELEHVGGSKD